LNRILITSSDVKPLLYAPETYVSLNMKFFDHLPVIVAVLILAIVLVGEVIVSTDSHDDFSSSISVDGDRVDFELGSRNNHVYEVLSLRNTLETPENVFIYYDKGHISAVDKADVSTGARALDENYYVQQLVHTLEVRGINTAKIVNAEALKELMSSDGKGKSVVMLSGSIPSTVYDGEEDSLILKWIESGGRLYWLGNVLGKYISSGDSLITKENGTTLFLGAECIQTDQVWGTSTSEGDVFWDLLYFQNNETTYGVDPSKLPDSAEYKCIGYSDGTCSTFTFVTHGSGMICVVGGEYSNNQRMDLAHVIAAGIGPTTVLVEDVKGSVSGSVKGTIARGDSVYVIIGGLYTVYCENHEVI